MKVQRSPICYKIDRNYFNHLMPGGNTMLSPGIKGKGTLMQI